MTISFYFKASQPAADPNLEIALALSASLALSMKESEEKFQEMSEDSKQPSPPTMPEIIMPEATVWPIRYKKGGKNPLAKTTLQVQNLYLSSYVETLTSEKV